MPSKGSTYSTIKTAIITRLRQRSFFDNVSVEYQAPLQARDTRGLTGVQERIFFSDELIESGDFANVIICATPLQWDETYPLPLVIEVAMPESDGTQQLVDQRLDEMLYQVLTMIAHDPSFGIVEPEFRYAQAPRMTWRREGGVLPTGQGHGGRIVLYLAVEGRISFYTEA